MPSTVEASLMYAARQVLVAERRFIINRGRYDAQQAADRAAQDADFRAQQRALLADMRSAFFAAVAAAARLYADAAAARAQSQRVKHTADVTSLLNNTTDAAGALQSLRERLGWMPSCAPASAAAQLLPHEASSMPLPVTAQLLRALAVLFSAAPTGLRSFGALPPPSYAGTDGSGGVVMVTKAHGK
ncbi:hypothetical protein EON77_18140, partial [bacterium]